MTIESAANGSSATVGFVGSEPSPGQNNEAMDLSGSRAAKKRHDEILNWALEQFTTVRNARTTTERQWYLNLAFYFGKQNVAVLRPQSTTPGVGVATRLYTPPAPYYRSRPVINRIRPTIRTELSQLTGNRPNASVVPASAEDRDMYAAMAGEQIWDNFYTDKKIKSIIRRSMWWTLVCGTGFVKSYWDWSQGPLDEQTGKPSGDVCFAPETPFHILVPDFREEELESQPYVMHVQTKSVDYVQMNFKQAIDGSKLAFGDSDTNDILEESFLNLTGTQDVQKRKNVLMLEVWIKPGVNPRFPEGACFTIAGNKIVQGWEGQIYDHGKYPFAKFDHIPGGKFYSTSSIEDLIPLQKEYNRTRGQIIEAKNRMAKPQLIAARGSVDVSKITTEPGLVIQYVPGFTPPTPLPLQALPNYVIQEIDRILGDWKDIAGQHEVTHGQMPPGVTAATAISYLQERDESKLSPTFDSLEEGIEKIAQLSLSYVHQFWTDERIIRVTGPDGSFDAMAFRGSDLRNNLDIRVEGGSALPVSKAAKQAFIMDMMKMGFIDPQEGLEVMEMGGINKIYERVQVDQRQVQRENLRMSKVTAEVLQEFNQQNAEIMKQNPEQFEGMAPPLLIPTNTWDNHKLHIEYHNRFRKGQAFENLPEEAKALFEAHVQQHINALGMETVTLNPRASVGLPDMPPEEEGQAPSNSQPGPEPMPQLEGV